MNNFIPIKDFPNYFINNEGVVKNVRGKILSCPISNSGYYFYNLKREGKQCGVFRHRLIAIHFIPLVDGKDFVNHINGIKTDNRIENLEWCTRSENVQHCYDTGLKTYKPLHYKGKTGFNHNKSKSIICKNTGVVYGSISEASRELNVGCSTLHYALKNGTTLKGTNKTFKYAI